MQEKPTPRITLEIGSGTSAHARTHYHHWRKSRGPGDILILSDPGFKVGEKGVPAALEGKITERGKSLLGRVHGTKNPVAIQPEDSQQVWFMRQQVPNLDFLPGSLDEIVAHNLFSYGPSGFSIASLAHLTIPRPLSPAIEALHRSVKPGGRVTITDALAPHLVRWEALKKGFEKREWKVKLARLRNKDGALVTLIAKKQRAPS